MNYWIYVTSFENWLLTKEKNVLGISLKYQSSLKTITVGDKCLIYTKPAKFCDEKIDSSLVAVYEIKSDSYVDNFQIFSPAATNPKEKFSLRWDIVPLKIFDKPHPFKKYVNQVNFVTNKTRWGMTFMGRAMIKISSDDFILLSSDQ